MKMTVSLTERGKDQKEGNMNEYNVIGDKYYDGDGVEQSYETAFSYYMKAAEMNDPEGYFNLAWCYENGYGTEQSDTNAVIYYNKAGELGVAKAWRNLGFKLFFSVTDDADPKLKESFNYMLKAADMGDASAQAHIAQAYQGGAGWGAPEADHDKAKAYLARAVEQGNEHAMWVLAENYSNGSFGYEQNAGLALTYYRKAAEAGSSKAMHDMAMITYFGFNGAERDPSEAFDWACKAYREGDVSDNSVFFGALLMHGFFEDSADEDYSAGKQLIAEGAEAGIPLAEYLELRIELIEKNFGKVSPELAENLLYLAYINDHHTEYVRDEKELLVEAQAPRIINMALDGDFSASAGLSRIFMPNTNNNEDFGGEAVSSLRLSEKWAEQAYKCDPVKGMDLYISTLALIGYIDNQIGAYNESEQKFIKVCRLTEEAGTLPGYEGLASDPAKRAEYYTDCAFVKIQTGDLDGAYNIFRRAEQEQLTSDALYGLFKVHSEENYYDYNWEKAVKYIIEASRRNIWMNTDRKAEAHYLLGMMYKDPAFAPFAGNNINKSYEAMNVAAELGFAPAAEEMPHYKQNFLGGYKYV